MFGVNPGSEFSGDRYATLINKDDSIYNPVLNDLHQINIISILEISYMMKIKLII